VIGATAGNLTVKVPPPAADDGATMAKASVCILTPREDHNDSPLWPELEYAPGRKWSWYHECLDATCDGAYALLEQHGEVNGFDAVLVHEGLFTLLEDRTVDALARLRGANGRVIWVEQHERTLFSGAVFLDGFFDAVDLVLKHQLMRWPTLRDALKSGRPDLGPWALFGYPSYPSFVGDRRLFGGLVRSEDLKRHQTADLEPLYGSRIQPLMYLFSSAVLDRGRPSRQIGTSEFPLTEAGRFSIAHYQRKVLTSALRRAGVEVRDDLDYLEAIARSRAFLGLGHIHSSLRTFDTMLFDTVLVHFGPGPYVVWPEFREYETYLPFGDVSRMFSHGGASPEWNYIDEACATLARDLADEALLSRVLAGQAQLIERVLDPEFIVDKLGIRPGA
jgi:hypothetical protein